MHQVTSTKMAFRLQPEENQELTEEEASLIEIISNAVHDELTQCGADQINADITDDVLSTVAAVCEMMQSEKRTALNVDDYELIRLKVRKLTMKFVPKPKRRFALLDRVVCRIGGDIGWAAGAVQSLDEDDPSDPTGQRVLPYVVKLDPPVGRMISAPSDDNSVIVAEVCFGQRRDALWFTRMCLPKAVRKGAQRSQRFNMGDRVACAVEDATGNYADWAHGTVTAVGYPVEAEDGVAGGVAPYQVLLDNGGCSVLVHQDEHWLLRDLQYQPVGPQATKASRTRERLVRRHKGDYTFEAIDHMTRRVRPCPPPASDSEHSDDCDCAGCA